MNDLEKTYDEKFFAKRNSLLWRADILCPAIMNVLQPESLIDVGCAIGDFVKWFNDNGINAYGLEGSVAVRKYMVIPEKQFSIMDLRKSLLFTHRSYDLAMSIEVAEHIEPEYAEMYVKNLISLSDRLLLTIAGPGQKGHSHVNLQPMEYWDALFIRFNYQRHAVIESKLKAELYPHQKNRWVNAIINNLVFYREVKIDHTT